MRILSLLFSFLFLVSSAWAHGLKGEIGRGGIVITAQYENNEPISYAKVEIFAPNSKIRFQSGRTDKNGRFSFVPDRKGKWQVIIDDEDGHKLTIFVSVNNVLNSEVKRETADLLIFTKVILGILAIFGLFCLTITLKDVLKRIS